MARMRILTVTAAAIAALVLGACSSSGGKSGGGGAANSIRIGLTAPVVGDEPQFAAELGYFKDAGIDVTIDDKVGSANIQNALVSGKIDLAQVSFSEAQLIAGKGHSTVVIAGTKPGGTAAFLVGSPKIKTLEQIKAKAGKCTLATSAPGGSTYGWASFYNQTLGLNCKLMSLGDGNLVATSVAAGRADVGVGALTYFASGMQAGKLNQLINANDASDRSKYMNNPGPEIGWVGLTDTIAKKRDVVVKMLKALDRAGQAFKTMSDADVAAIYHKESSFNALTLDAMTQNMKAYRPNLDLVANEGRISESDWDSLLQREKGWGLQGFDASAAVNSYASRVDPTYLDAALGANAGGK